MFLQAVLFQCHLEKALSFSKIGPNKLSESATWLSINAFLFEAGSRRFKSWAGQIGHNVANGLLPLRHFFEKDVLPAGASRNDVVMGPANSLHASA